MSKSRVLWIGLALLLVVAVVLPFLVKNYRVFQFNLVLVYAIAILGLNILTGFNGQISLGHGAFYAIGAYAAAILMDRVGMPYWLTLPFSADQRFVRIGDALVQGPEMGASAQGIIRKVDGRMDIGGTIIPAYALNAALSEVPVLGEVLMGGRGQGVFGLNFALQGTMQDPRFVVNPVSAIAPGFLRHLFSIGGGGTNPDGTPAGPRRPLRDPRG